MAIWSLNLYKNWKHLAVEEGEESASRNKQGEDQREVATFCSITNKQTNKQYIYIYIYIFFFMIYKLQVYVLYNIQIFTSSHTGDNNKKTKKNPLFKGFRLRYNWLLFEKLKFFRGSCTPCGKITRKENLEQSQKPFLRAPII